MTRPLDDPPRILVLASGPFGAGVADRLRQRHDLTIIDITDHGTHPSHWPYADLVILATSREHPQITEAIDRAAFEQGFRWFPILGNATELRCGPVVIPDRTACHACYLKRREQHGSHEGKSEARPGAREHPTGHPAHHLGIGAGLAEQAITEAFEGPRSDSLGGTVRVFTQVEGSTGRFGVLAVNLCGRCRHTPPDRNLWSHFQHIAGQTSGPRKGEEIGA